MFCNPLEQSTKGEDVMQKLTEFFESEDLDWGNLCGIYTDGAPAMLGSSSLHDPQASSCIRNATLRITRHFEYNYKDS